MLRHLIYVTALLSALLGLSGAAFSRTPLEPVQHVYPDSTFEEIQQAIDNGGTVYFERLTRQTGEYGQYNQLASPTPDVAPKAMAEVRDKGFFIGKYGKDVDIIGMLGSDGARPRINGGTIVFRAGAFARMGIVGLPVNFRIENLEMNNPDMADAPLMNSRVGIMVVSALGAQSVVNNCKFTITGKQTDTGHAINHSVAIWFYLEATYQPHPPVNAARIDITNNVVIGSRIHEGIHVSNYWPQVPGVTTPRVFINNNTLQLKNLGGYPNKGGTNGATLASGILVTGDLSAPIITNNTISGDGRSPGVTPNVESIGIRLSELLVAPDRPLGHATVVGNDFSSFASDFQLWVGAAVSSSVVARNSFGPASGAGIMCQGQENWIDRNNFFGDYPGWESSAGSVGLVCFTKTTAGNRLTRMRLNGHPAMCGQVDDQTGGSNIVPGYERCEAR